MHTSMTSGRKVEAFRGSNAVSAVRIRTGRPLGMMKKCDQKEVGHLLVTKKGAKRVRRLVLRLSVMLSTCPGEAWRRST